MPAETRRYAVLDAPSSLGLEPHGVERLPDRLLELGLESRTNARRAGRLGRRAPRARHARRVLHPPRCRQPERHRDARRGLPPPRRAHPRRARGHAAHGDRAALPSGSR
nr:MAG: hypothetical protein DIU78_20805 [Pseudomonadota bacterium]